MSYPIILMKPNGITFGFNDLNAAIGMGENGDTITVYPGIYSGQIEIRVYN